MLFEPRPDSFPGLVGGLSQTGAATFTGVLVAYLLSALIMYVHQPTAKRALRVDKRDSEQYLAKVQEP
jgi:hypothetical protein